MPIIKTGLLLFSFQLPADLIEKFLKFGVVGLSGMAVDFGFTILLKEKLKVQKYVSNAVGFCMAVVSNYFLNRWWTFRSTDVHVMHQFSTFFFVALVGLSINSFVLWILVSKKKYKFYFSKLIAIGVVTFWNFGINYFFTFR